MRSTAIPAANVRTDVEHELALQRGLDRVRALVRGGHSRKVSGWTAYMESTALRAPDLPILQGTTTR